MTDLVFRISRDRVVGHWTVRQLAVMLKLYPNSRWDFGELVKELGLCKPHLSRAMDALSDRGWAQRTRNKLDKRRCWLTLTEDGRAVMREFVEDKARAA